MKTEPKNKHQFTIIMNNTIREQLKYLASKHQKTEAKFIKDLVNQKYLDCLVKER